VIYVLNKIAMDSLINDALQYSVQKLGYTSIRQHQKDILEKLLTGQDCLLVAPTGSGKSFIFEAIPPALQYLNTRQSLSNKGNVVVVVSPLISLMRLQAKRLQERNISAAYLQVS
jgi:ATP-dependent DNA helicase RecQ